MVLPPAGADSRRRVRLTHRDGIRGHSSGKLGQLSKASSTRLMDHKTWCEFLHLVFTFRGGAERSGLVAGGAGRSRHRLLADPISVVLEIEEISSTRKEAIVSEKAVALTFRGYYMVVQGLRVFPSQIKVNTRLND